MRDQHRTTASLCLGQDSEVFGHNPTIGSSDNRIHKMSEPAAPLVLSKITTATTQHQQGKTNLSKRTKPSLRPLEVGEQSIAW